ncbi:hypothetical protein IKS57_06255 [bacterium]|nr:hypothetical protein [bacterium]
MNLFKSIYSAILISLKFVAFLVLDFFVAFLAVSSFLLLKFLPASNLLFNFSDLPLTDALLFFPKYQG